MVRLPDKKDLLSYLNGESSTSANIDRSAPLEIYAPRPVAKRATLAREVEEAAANAQDAKRPRLEDAAVQREKERLAAKLDASKPAMVLPDQAKSSSLSEAMPLEKIQALRAKVLAKMRKTIKSDDTDVMTSGHAEIIPRSAYLSSDNLIKDVLSKERRWKTRHTVLQSHGKDFADNILNRILKSVKLLEEGYKPANSSEGALLHSSAGRLGGGAGSGGGQLHQMAYSRYDQERFASRQDEAAALFGIDTSGTYHGVNLQSVATAGGSRPSDPRQRPAPIVSDPRAPQDPRRTPSGTTESGTPHASGTPTSGRGSVIRERRTPRTPIIIIPVASASLVSMLNAKDLLQDMRFVAPEEKRAGGARRDNEVLIQRLKPDGTTVPYRVVDAPMKLSPEEWERVAAVFVQGPAWQFKGWPLGRDPPEIFCKIRAFHLKYSDLPLDTNVAKWNVHVIQLDRNKRHLDRANLQQFWEHMDRYMVKQKPHLRH